MRKTFKNYIFLLNSIFILGLTSCVNPFSNLKIIKTNTNGIKLNLSTTKESSGNYISPEEVQYSYNIFNLNNEKLLDTNKVDLPYNPQINEIQTFDILVLPLHFKESQFNSTFKQEEIKSDLFKAFNGSQNDEKLGYLSVKEYYYLSSYNKVNLNFDIADFYNVQKPMSYYSSSKQTLELLNEATEQITINNENIDYKKYDKNTDGFLDAVWLIYDVPNYALSNSNNTNFWAYSYYDGNSKSDINKPDANAFSWASVDFMYNTYKNKIDTHFYVHETGHLFGLNDYYDYNKKVAPLSGFDMMDHNIFDQNAFSKMILGWTKPYIVYGDSTINYNDLKSKHAPVVILSNSEELYFDKSTNKYLFNPFREYILLDQFNMEYGSINQIESSKDYPLANLEYPKVFDEDMFKIYHVDGRMIFKDLVNKNSNFVVYDKDMIFNSTNYQVSSFVSNNTDGRERKAEEAILKSKGLDDFISKDIGYFNQITLLHANALSNFNYKNNYYKHVDLGDGTYKNIVNSITKETFLNKGDIINFNIYKNYFVNGIQNDCIVFNNFSKLQLVINFN